MRIIAVSGTNGSGKDYVPCILANWGFKHISLSDILREEANRLGLSVEDRSVLVKLGNDTRKEFGPGCLAEIALNIAGENGWNSIVVTSVRNLGEVSYLRKMADSFSLWWIDAPVEIRFERTRVRQREGGGDITLEQFIAEDEREMRGGDDEQHLEPVKNVANLSFDNKHEKERFRQEVLLAYFALFSSRF